MANLKTINIMRMNITKTINIMRINIVNITISYIFGRKKRKILRTLENTSSNSTTVAKLLSQRFPDIIL